MVAEVVALTKVLVCGGRDFADRAMLDAALDRLHQERGFSLVIAGGARGADTLAEEWAKARGIACDVYRADWEGLGRKAGPIRNERMLVEGKPDVVVAFPGGRGTAHMVRIAREAGIEVIENSRHRVGAPIRGPAHVCHRRSNLAPARRVVRPAPAEDEATFRPDDA